MTLNGNAAKIVKKMREKSEELNIDIHTLDNGTALLDCGVNAEGGIEAGRLFSAVCMGGLADLRVFEDPLYAGLELKSIHVETEKPRLACIGSQKAAWRIKVGDFFAMGSGPARLLLRSSNQEFHEKSRVGVIALECSRPPDKEVSEHVSKKCGIKPENLTILAAGTDSLAGSTQVSARMVETALYKMDYLGMDAKVIKASGKAPIAPVIGDEGMMMGVENDMIIYGSHVDLLVEGEVDVELLPSSKSPDYGLPFFEVFKRADYDFYKIDQGIFAPAEISVRNVETNEVRSAGKINLELIQKALKSP